MLRFPNIDFLVANQFASLQNYLLCRVELSKKGLSSIAGWVSINLLLNVLGELQVLIDLSIHLQASLISWLLE